MLLLRHVGAFFANLVLYAVRSGRWWVPVFLLTLLIASVVGTAAKVVVPTTVYTLF